MVITEAELREAWREGRGQLPDIPADARLSPSAKDFLAALARQGSATTAARPMDPATYVSPSPMAEDGLVLRSTDGRRLILTASDVDELVAKPPATIVIHPSATLTDAARERLSRAGVRVMPWIEPKAEAVRPAQERPAAPKAEAKADDLRARIKSAVLARLDGKFDEAVVDAVISRVLSALGD